MPEEVLGGEVAGTPEVQVGLRWSLCLRKFPVEGWEEPPELLVGLRWSFCLRKFPVGLNENTGFSHGIRAWNRWVGVPECRLVEVGEPQEVLMESA